MSDGMLRQMAKRFAIFMLLGPLLVWLSAFMLHVPRLIRMPDANALTAMFFFIVFFIAFGLIPGAVLAGADWLMERWKLSRVVRVAACAVLAYPVTLAALWYFLRDLGVRPFTTDLPVTALFGMIPAAVCSWLAGKAEGKNAGGEGGAAA
jgi:hypothetical protein